MLTAMMIGQDSYTCAMIRSTIEQYCTDVVFNGMVAQAEADVTVKGTRPDMIFWDSPEPIPSQSALAPKLAPDILNFLLIDDAPAVQALLAKQGLDCVHALLYKPLHVPEVLIALSSARNFMELRRSLLAQRESLSQLLDRQSHPGSIGIPTDEGIDFVCAQDILRCEGLNKYTLIVTQCQRQIISSYNIGEFARLLQPHGFFAAHKSHLVNLCRVKRLTADNMLILQDGSQVPLSRRRRLDFLARFR
jgi:two-component system, LytTR family, response regulator